MLIAGLLLLILVAVVGGQAGRSCIGGLLSLAFGAMLLMLVA